MSEHTSFFRFPTGSLVLGVFALILAWGVFPGTSSAQFGMAGFSNSPYGLGSAGVVPSGTSYLSNSPNYLGPTFNYGGTAYGPNALGPSAYSTSAAYPHWVSTPNAPTGLSNSTYHYRYWPNYPGPTYSGTGGIYRAYQPTYYNYNYNSIPYGMGWSSYPYGWSGGTYGYAYPQAWGGY